MDEQTAARPRRSRAPGSGPGGPRPVPRSCHVAAPAVCARAGLLLRRSPGPSAASCAIVSLHTDSVYLAYKLYATRADRHSNAPRRRTKAERSEETRAVPVATARRLFAERGLFERRHRGDRPRRGSHPRCALPPLRGQEGPARGRLLPDRGGADPARSANSSCARRPNRRWRRWRPAPAPSSRPARGPRSSGSSCSTRPPSSAGIAGGRSRATYGLGLIEASLAAAMEAGEIERAARAAARPRPDGGHGRGGDARGPLDDPARPRGGRRPPGLDPRAGLARPGLVR